MGQFVVQRWVLWPSLAAVMGFIIGGLVVWGIQFRGPPAHVPADEAIADYTRWLMIFTGILAVATVGLGAATVGLYLTGEKQIKVAMRAAEAAERSVIAADRAWLVVQIQLVGDLIFEPEDIEIHAEYIITNVGKSPATDVAGDMRLFADATEAKRWIAAQAAAVQTRSIDKAGFGHMLFPGGQMKFDYACSVLLKDFRGKIDEVKEDAGTTENEGRPALACFFTYALPSEMKPAGRYSADVFEICPSGPKDPWRGFDGRPRVVDRAKLELKKTYLGGRAS